MNPQTACVLVVDDIAENRDILERRLARLGIGSIEQATNGREALAAIERRNFDLVLLDIMMPEMDGFEVLQHLKARGRLTDLPVIVISALSDLEPVVRCIELGAEDFILKPFNATLLRARILATLEKKKLRDHMRDDLARKQAELADARTLQLALVPANYRGHHHGRLISIDIVLEPAREVGGDLVDHFVVGDELLVVLVGDVSGKGAGPALMMARTQALFRGLLSRPDVLEIFRSPERAVDLVNAILCRGNASCMFVTMLLAVMELRTGRLSCVRAGHVAPFLSRADGGVERVLCDTDLPLGLMDADYRYRSTTITLEPNDHLLIVTDGVTEATNPLEELFGEERVEVFMAQPPGDETLGHLVRQVREFESGLPSFDDVAAIHLRYEPGDRLR
ncbi:MAG: response regulator receiver protein [Burkholderiales bacterium 28-67-8]|nr:MAG: response regulator receiver protein [Burkholderiales bacterium 28-67-8]